MTGRSGFVAGLTFVMLSASCTGEPAPTEIPPEDLPFSLRRGAESSPRPIVDEPLTIFFVRGGKLIPTKRAPSSEAPPVEVVIRALVEGPTRDELRRGVTSQIPSRTSLLGVRVVNLVAEVDLSAEFQSPGSRDAVVVRVAQVVWTLVRLPEVTAVRFVIDGEPVSVVTDDGTAVDRPVTAPDYATVAPDN